MADFSLDAPKAVLLVMATTLVFPFSKWAAEKLFNRTEKDIGDAEKKAAELHVLIVKLSEKVDERFTGIRNLIEGQNLSIRELQIEQRHADQRLTKLEEEVKALPAEIEKSRHILRNELTPLILKTTLKRKGEEDDG